jgi:hypothetical protein
MTQMDADGNGGLERGLRGGYGWEIELEIGATGRGAVFRTGWKPVSRRAMSCHGWVDWVWGGSDNPGMRLM